jgi:hypothetical protein
MAFSDESLANVAHLQTWNLLAIVGQSPSPNVCFSYHFECLVPTTYQKGHPLLVGGWHEPFLQIVSIEDWASLLLHSSFWCVVGYTLSWLASS